MVYPTFACQTQVDGAVQRALHVEVERMGKAWLVWICGFDMLSPFLSWWSVDLWWSAASWCFIPTSLCKLVVYLQLSPTCLYSQTFCEALDSDDTKALQVGCRRHFFDSHPHAFAMTSNVFMSNGGDSLMQAMMNWWSANNSDLDELDLA